MNLESRIEAFSKLGDFLSQYGTEGIKRNHVIPDALGHFELLNDSIERAHTENPWFTESNILYAFESWSRLLRVKHLTDWIKAYSLENKKPKIVAVIMAGNIPLVGFHDFLSVLLVGHKVLVKQSSNDKVLLNILTKVLTDIEPEFKDLISFTKEKLTGFDAVIATGSNNTARYFDYYFRKFPNIIRKNRNSIAVLSGKESPEDLDALSYDIFRYYGLGCRNVSKLYVPKDYNFDPFFNAIYKWHPIVHDHKYANNYDYNKAVYLMSEFDILDNGFLVLKEDEQLASPIATLNFEYYENLSALRSKLNDLEEDIQCVVANGFNRQEVKFGQTQRPDLTSYADGVDTVEFLLKI